MKLLMSMVVLLLSTQSWANEYEPKLRVMPVEDAQWGHLNPLRGDQSPGAADLWGDRTSSGATGMLVRFKQGFSSPPHIHNVSYRGVVIEGSVHNDDPTAEFMWLSPGSFWTQPAGQAHITAAQGKQNLIYVEIDSGPYLVKPVSEQFDQGEKPVNMDQTNLVWLNGSELNWINHQSTEEPATAVLWAASDDDQLRGLMLRLPAHFSGKLVTDAREFRAVVVSGKVRHQLSNPLGPGSYFESSTDVQHELSSGDETVVLYLRTNGLIQIESQ